MIKSGTKVKMTIRNAKWHLDHPEIYFCIGSQAEYNIYENETFIHLCCAMGVPVIGTTGNKGCEDNVYRVVWKVGKRIAWAYYKKGRDFEPI